MCVMCVGYTYVCTCINHELLESFIRSMKYLGFHLGCHHVFLGVAQSF